MTQERQYDVCSAESKTLAQPCIMLISLYRLMALKLKYSDMTSLRAHSHLCVRVAGLVVMYTSKCEWVLIVGLEHTQ